METPHRHHPREIRVTSQAGKSAVVSCAQLHFCNIVAKDHSNPKKELRTVLQSNWWISRMCYRQERQARTEGLSHAGRGTWHRGRTSLLTSVTSESGVQFSNSFASRSSPGLSHSDVVAIATGKPGRGEPRSSLYCLTVSS